MIGAFARMYQVFGQESYLRQAKRACEFLEAQHGERDFLPVSCRHGIELYRAVLERKYLERAKHYCRKAQELFEDQRKGGFFLYGKENERLIAATKETYDGAIPSGNSVMAYNLVKLWQITGEEHWREQAKKQLKYLSVFAERHPAGQSFSLLAALLYQNPPAHIVGVLKEEKDLEKLRKIYGKDSDIMIFWEESQEYGRINNRATLYICKDGSCKPPVNL